MMLHQVNKIREVPQHADVVVTHTDSKELFVWHTERQPNRKEKVLQLFGTHLPWHNRVKQAI